jgi:hypothetical protein
MTKKDGIPPEAYDSEDPAVVGVGRKVAYALAVLGLDVVQRSTLRALLPPGVRKTGGVEAKQNRRLAGKTGLPKRNRTTQTFQEKLRDFEKWGWISRGHVLIAVHDRGALLDHALHGREAIPPRLLDLDAALARLRADEGTAEPNDRLLEQRRREFRALMRLMQAPVTGVNRSGTRSVRFVNRSRVI